MVQIEIERTISAPAARIWEVVASADRLPQWYARSDRVEVAPGQWLREGIRTLNPAVNRSAAAR